MASAGNSTDFGDLTLARAALQGSSGKTRGCFGGARDGSGNYQNTIDYITTASAGNATDFGDLQQVKSEAGGCSSAHGGLK